MEKVLLIEDEIAIRNRLLDLLQRKNLDVLCLENPLQALESIEQTPFDLIFCNLKMAKSIELLKAAKEHHPQSLIILLTSLEDVEKAAEAMRLGAFNYLIKPFSSDTFEVMLEKAQQQASLIQENHYLRQEISLQSGEKKNQIIAESLMMKRILSDVSKVAQSHASVFICGESGTGKEVIAQAIHSLSSRKQAPFIKVNCAAIPETLIESEFFGHEKGAFTGAINKRLGRFELAHTGTLLLDEITEIPLSVQSKLLRVVQEQEFERVGGTRPIRVDVRLISTSNRNMKEAIDQKIFREDLYYRLNVVPIFLAPLRERKDDILPLAEYFLERLSAENKQVRKHLSEEARKKLINYPWPGNIRELANIIERTVVMSPSETIRAEDLSLDHLPTKLEPLTYTPTTMTLEEVEKQHILATLTAHNLNRTKTAKVLGISIRTLRNKLHEYKGTSSK